MFGGSYLEPLLFDEILTISLYGTSDELAQLEACLDENDKSGGRATEQKIVHIAGEVRRRLLTGLHSSCCPRCKNYDSCEQKWYRAERGLRSTCCFRCGSFVLCAEEHKKDRMRRLAGSGRLDRESVRPHGRRTGDRGTGGVIQAGGAFGPGSRADRVVL